MKLTPKQELFCNEYLIDLNATAAAERAGYNKKTAYSQGQRLLKHVEIQNRIQERMGDRSKRTEITQDRVLQELAHIAFDNISNYLDYRTEKTVVGHDIITGKPIIEYATIVDLKDSKTVDTRSIAEVSIGANGVFKFKQYCKDNALVQLGKHLGMFVDKVESTNTNLNLNKDVSELSDLELEEELNRLK